MVMQKLSKLCARKVLILDSSGNNPTLAVRLGGMNSSLENLNSKDKKSSKCA